MVLTLVAGTSGEHQAQMATCRHWGHRGGAVPLAIVATVGRTTKVVGAGRVKWDPMETPKWFDVCLAQYAYHCGGTRTLGGAAGWAGHGAHATGLGQVPHLWDHGKATPHRIKIGHTKQKSDAMSTLAKSSTQKTVFLPHIC